MGGWNGACGTRYPRALQNGLCAKLGVERAFRAFARSLAGRAAGLTEEACRARRPIARRCGRCACASVIRSGRACPCPTAVRGAGLADAACCAWACAAAINTACLAKYSRRAYRRPAAGRGASLAVAAFSARPGTAATRAPGCTKEACRASGPRALLSALEPGRSGVKRPGGTSPRPTAARAAGLAEESFGTRCPCVRASGRGDYRGSVERSSGTKGPCARCTDPVSPRSLLLLTVTRTDRAWNADRDTSRACGPAAGSAGGAASDAGGAGGGHCVRAKTGTRRECGRTCEHV